MRQVMYLPYETNHSSVYNRKDLNSSFAEGTLKVMYTGENRNHSSIDRATVEAALPSLYNIPIVAHYDRDTNCIGGHDIELRKDANGRPYLHTLTVPCGLVPEHAVFSFQEDVDENGVSHEYLVVDGVLLWKREPVYRHIDEDLGGKVDHSMEIEILDGASDRESGIYRIKKFEFQALCLLERDRPCFEGSMLELFSLDEFRLRMAEMMQDLKESFSLVPSQKEDDRHHSKEGGETLENQMTELEEKAVEAVEEPVESEPVQKAEFSEAEEQAAPAEEETVEIPEAEPAAETSEGEFALSGDLSREFCEIFSQEMIEMPWGPDCRYWMLDYDFDLHKVYVQDNADWRLYSFDYVMNGDHVLVDFASKTRVKYAFVPYDNGDDSSAASAFSRAAEMFTKVIDELREFKAETERREDLAARERVFASFADLAGVEAFEKLREKNADLSVAVLEEKCYAIRGKVGTPAKFSIEQDRPRLPVEHRDALTEDEPYGGVVERYRR